MGISVSMINDPFEKIISNPGETVSMLLKEEIKNSLFSYMINIVPSSKDTLNVESFCVKILHP